MLIRLLYAHEMTKHVCTISRLNSKRLLRKLQKILGVYFFAAPCIFKHLHSTIKSEDTEMLGGLRARSNEIKAQSSRPT